MRKAVILCLLLLGLSGSAQADVIVEELLVRRQDESVNIRVNLRNPGTARQNGPIVITLYVRASERDGWTMVKSWSDVKFLQPGYKVSRDYFDKNNTLLAELAAAGEFQARASVTAPGIKDAVEKTSWYGQNETGR